MDKKDFARFYQKHLDKIYRFVFFRVGGQRELAEDLVSEIFIKALNNFEKYQEEKSQSAWIFTIAKNHLANYYRGQSRHPAVSLEEAEDYSLQLAKTETLLDLDKLLNKLDEEKRELVTFKYLLGYSYAEIGKILGISEGAAKVATHRAIKELKAKKYVS